MSQAKTAAAKAKRTAADRPDPRFAALARLLARDLARKHFEKELKGCPEDAYSADSDSGDQP